MTASTVTHWDYPLPGFKCGIATARDTYTLDTGLGDSDDVVFVARGTTDDCAIAVTSIAGGIVTLAIHNAGSPQSSDEVIYWMAARKGTVGAASDGVQDFEFPLPGFACGLAEVKNGETINTGLGDANIVFLACATTDDAVVSATSTTGGIATLDMQNAGSALTSDETVHWMAWRKAQ